MRHILVLTLSSIGIAYMPMFTSEGPLQVFIVGVVVFTFTICIYCCWRLTLLPMAQIPGTCFKVALVILSIMLLC